MSLLKLSALTISGIALWLAPPAVLSRKIPMHGLVQGVALVSAFACCFEARRTAIALAKAEDFEAMEQRAIIGDAEDELATSVYVAEQKRRKEAEQILNPMPNPNDAVLLLERALAINSEGSEPEVSEPDLTPEEQELAEKIQNLKVRGYGKVKIILELWGASKGGGAKYKAAEAEYKRLVGE
ncbi:hypothetical protein QUB68_29750 [Microcoleus sp. A006_D1]|uniref:hypothetical protein n=1 Tax=Microcoleus sp. A006_D1 TaxID=3055267 RepID=UPI002FD55079